MAQTVLEKVVCTHTRTLHDKDGYRVCKFTAEDPQIGLFTAVGSDVPVIENGKVNLYGEWTFHKTFGRQFLVNFSEEVLPTTLKGFTSYVKSLKIRIGTVKCHAVYRRFGDKVWEVLETEPERFLSVPGFTKKNLNRLQDKLKETQQIRSVLSFFQGECDMTPGRAHTIIEAWGDKAISRLQSHPYWLCSLRGFTFDNVDEFAQKYGAKPNSTDRLRAIILSILNDAAREGSVCMERDEFLAKAKKFISACPNGEQISQEDLMAAVNKTIRQGFVKFTSGMLYCKEQYEQERSIERSVLSMCQDTEQLQDVDAYIKQYQEDTGITLAESQIDAVRMVLTKRLCVLTGGPGTGKTTTTKAILYVHRLAYGGDHKPVLLAPTGRAARRMSEATGYPAATIHSAIGVTDKGETDVSAAHIDGNLIIVDECSMMDQQIASLLLERIPDGARVVLVGDPDQLPSVGCGDVLRDLIRCKVVPVTKLNVIYRQGADSPIITNAYKINSGDVDLDYAKSFKFIECEREEEIFSTAIDFYLRCVKQFGLDEVVLLNPWKRKGDLCVNTFNQALQARLNPVKEGEKTMKVGSLTFHAGDKIMQTRNREEAKNGDVGYVKRIELRPDPEDPDETKEFAIIEFNGDGIEHAYAYEQMRTLDLAYATTIHKSQGSQYKTVLMVVANAHTSSLKRKLVYTGITRAEENVALIGQKSALETAIRNDREEPRLTMLADLLHAHGENIK